VKIALGSDHLALAMKNELVQYVESLGHEVTDCGCHTSEPVDYPDIAALVARRIRAGEAERGILICGTGIGMAMAANKIRGIRAAQCHDVYSAERAAKSNNAHIITLGARVVGVELAKCIVRAWLESFFSGGQSEKKIEKIMMLEQA
jgi:ribose 5-phosphate isomerase B